MRLFVRQKAAASTDGVAKTGAGSSAREWGFPGPCPECGGAGYLDRIDMVNEVMHQHCPFCGKVWQEHQADLEHPA